MSKQICSDIDEEIKNKKEIAKKNIQTQTQYTFITDDIYNLLYTFTEKYIGYKNSDYEKNMKKNMNNLSINNLTIYLIYSKLKPYIIEINELKKKYKNCNNKIRHGIL